MIMMMMIVVIVIVIVMNVIVMMEMVMWMVISTKIGHQLTVMTAASDVMHFINNKSIDKMQNKRTFQMTQSFYHKTKR